MTQEPMKNEQYATQKQFCSTGEGVCSHHADKNPSQVKFFVPGIPVPKGSAKAFYNRHLNRAVVMQDNRDRQKPWASLISVTAQEKGLPPTNAPVELLVVFVMPRPKSHFCTGKNSWKVKSSAPEVPIGKPDLDKLIRLVGDALTGIAWNDDSQVHVIIARKIYGTVPGAHIELRW